MVYVIATSRIKPGCMEEYLRILQENVPLVLAEEGCRLYAPCLDVADGPNPAEHDVLTIVESWDSMDHLRAHFAAPHMKAFVEAVKPLRLSSSARVVEPV